MSKRRGYVLSSLTTNNRSFFSDFKRFMPLLKNLVSKDFKIKYRRSVLGVAWSVLNPLFTMLVLTVVFRVILRIDVGVDFATYYIVGASLWNFFSEATSTSVSSILTAGALIRKVYIPKYIFPLEKCVFSLVNFAFSLVAVLAVMLIRGVYPTWTTLLFPIPVLYCFVFACGLSLFLSAVTVYFRDVQHLYSVLLTMWIYLTPILYSMDTLEKLGSNMQFVKYVVSLNPLTQYVNYFRSVVMMGQLPTLQDNLICMAMSLITLGFGALVFKKAEGKFILHL